jgi:hypothetical protein
LLPLISRDRAVRQASWRFAPSRILTECEFSTQPFVTVL